MGPKSPQALALVPDSACSSWDELSVFWAQSASVKLCRAQSVHCVCVPFPQPVLQAGAKHCRTQGVAGVGSPHHAHIGVPAPGPRVPVVPRVHVVVPGKSLTPRRQMVTVPRHVVTVTSKGRRQHGHEVGYHLKTGETRGRAERSRAERPTSRRSLPWPAPKSPPHTGSTARIFGSPQAK